MKKIVLLISTLLLMITGAKGQMSSDYSRSIETLQKMCDEANHSRYEFDYKTAAQYIEQAIMVFNTHPKDFQESNQAFKSELYYDLARYHSLEGNVDEALDAFEEAVDYGWNNFNFAKNDGDLDNIRRNKRFKSIMAAIKS